ncbi:hypothetical protein M409DRAFT_66313 [Zasmidium cellare ATCC 36951]|uniref:FAD/NAD(P)-binding domain-containing protein n=1 Tax=Zasmidium cellare ATCC 36951 TaxID=1080233 RepID=A0A6A6CJW6_ZASCE|nr:uncharacterized protein M409DRAFT_66313 [Zasmidium cellare ATCC 36951]KAF2167321.1 hypothetical protein M409DRAFT_66313 [Zasmidium cellare ATCC 36951]
MSGSGSDNLGKTVCVVGTGVMGLIAVKNFVEEGFTVTAYERHAYVGGLWHFTTNETQASVLSGTVTNGSKWLVRTVSFVCPDAGSDVPAYAPAKDIAAYLERYAEVFDVKKYIKFSTKVVKVDRDEKRRKWLIRSVSADAEDGPTETREFDRVIIATGRQQKSVTPRIEGADGFQGEMIHSHAFRDPEKYRGKTVMVVGSHATAADVQEFCLDRGAERVYLSHRREFRLLPRILPNGKPLDTLLSRRLVNMGATIKAISPALATSLTEKQFVQLRNETWPELATHPAFDGSRGKPDIGTGNPCISENLAQNLIPGNVESVRAVKRVTGPRSVELEDGREIDNVYAIICCFGSEFDFEVLVPPEYCPTNPDLAPEQFERLAKTKHWRDDLVVCRAYRQMISLQEPHSLAFFGHAYLVQSSFAMWDLVSMALAQLWKGSYPMPSSLEMQQECDEHFQWIATKLKQGEIGNTGILADSDFNAWLHKVAGTGLPERVDRWGWEAWKFWWYERKTYSLLMDGLNSPHALRLFETGRRKAWPQALQEIEKANREVADGIEERKKLSRGHPSGMKGRREA